MNYFNWYFNKLNNCKAFYMNTNYLLNYLFRKLEKKKKLYNFLF